MFKTTKIQQRAAELIVRIEAELKRIGMWQDQPPPPEAFQFERAFAIDTMAYSQWLQFIFIPRVHEIIAQHGQFPNVSHVGAQAIREFDGQDEANDLVRLLCEFDALFPNAVPTGAIGTSFMTGFPIRQRMKVVFLAISMGACMIMAFIVAFQLGGRLNKQLPRSMMWDAASDRTPEGVEAIFQFQTRIGSGSPAPMTIERLEMHLSLDIPPQPIETRIDQNGRPIRSEAQESLNRIQQNMRSPIMDHRVLVEQSPKAGEIQLSAVTRETVRDWFTDMLEKSKYVSPRSRSAVLSRADAVFETIEKARSAKTSDELLTLASAHPNPTGLTFSSVKPQLVYGSYLKDMHLMAAGLVMGLIALLGFYKPLMAVRRESIALRQANQNSRRDRSDIPDYR